MKNLKITMLAAAFVLIGQSIAGAQVSFGIRIGPPPAPRVVQVVPVQSGPEYTWLDGYWYPAAGQYRWYNGYWARPPYSGAYWVAPRHEGGLYFGGQWWGHHHEGHGHDHGHGHGHH